MSAINTMEALAEVVARTMWEQSYATLQDASWDVALQIAKHIPDGQAASCLATVRKKASEIVSLHFAPILAAHLVAPEAQGLETDKPLPLTHTNRGFAIAKFYDRYGEECSIQKSSLAEEDCIWLGADRDGAGRMHLSQETTARLLPLLQRFVTTGEIEPDPPASSGPGGR